MYTLFPKVYTLNANEKKKKNIEYGQAIYVISK